MRVLLAWLVLAVSTIAGPAGAQDAPSGPAFERLGPYNFTLPDPRWGMQRMRATFVVEAMGPELEKIRKQRQRIDNSLMKLIADINPQDLAGAQGHTRLKELMSEDVLRPLGIDLNEIFLTEFIQSVGQRP